VSRRQLGEAGTLAINEVPLVARTPRSVRAAGVAYVPEERMRDGAIGELTVAENLMLIDYRHTPSPGAGAAILLISEDLDEVMQLSDRTWCCWRGGSPARWPGAPSTGRRSACCCRA